MTKRIQTLALLVAAGALLAVPAIGEAAHKGSPHGAKSKRCKKPTVNKGFVLRGTVVSYTADNPTTANNEATPLVITVTKGNIHARRSGELKTDALPATAGFQYSVPTTDAFTTVLKEYEANEAPEAGDTVRLVGKVTVTKKRCASAQQDTVAKRYGDVDVKKVTFTEVG